MWSSSRSASLVPACTLRDSTVCALREVIVGCRCSVTPTYLQHFLGSHYRGLGVSIHIAHEHPTLFEIAIRPHPDIPPKLETPSDDAVIEEKSRTQPVILLGLRFVCIRPPSPSPQLAPQGLGPPEAGQPPATQVDASLGDRGPILEGLGRPDADRHGGPFRGGLVAGLVGIGRDVPRAGGHHLRSCGQVGSARCRTEGHDGGQVPEGLTKQEGIKLPPR